MKSGAIQADCEDIPPIILLVLPSKNSIVASCENAKLKVSVQANAVITSPGANVIDVNVSGDPDQNSMYINIVFSVINKAEPVTLELILNRIR